MANFTAADVKKLRELTGSGMKACKDALVETDGDFDKAVEILRIKGAKDVGKSCRAHRCRGPVLLFLVAPWSRSTPRPTSLPRTRSSSTSPTRSPTLPQQSRQTPRKSSQQLTSTVRPQLRLPRSSPQRSVRSWSCVALLLSRATTSLSTCTAVQQTCRQLSVFWLLTPVRERALQRLLTQQLCRLPL